MATDWADHISLCSWTSVKEEKHKFPKDLINHSAYTAIILSNFKIYSLMVRPKLGIKRGNCSTSLLRTEYHGGNYTSLSSRAK